MLAGMGNKIFAIPVKNNVADMPHMFGLSLKSIFLQAFSADLKSIANAYK
ncbi:MAG: hypothetical protein GY927_06360 [bacterium]|nr:hypothetical protein [bacterium]